jgi:hypothetical protein
LVGFKRLKFLAIHYVNTAKKIAENSPKLIWCEYFNLIQS